MNEEIYSTPESNLSKAEDFIQDNPTIIGAFDKPMLVAIAIQLALVVFLSITSFVGSPSTTASNVLVGFVTNAFWVFFLVYLIRRLRGNLVILKKQSSVYSHLGAWGYLWRSLVAKYLSFFLMLVALALFNGGAALNSSIDLTILSFGLSFVSSIVVVWLLFSRDRRAHFIWLVAIFRGY